MKPLYLIFALFSLLLVFPSRVVGAPSNGSGGGVGPGDIVINGTVTSDEFVSAPQSSAGGQFQFPECDGGGVCDSAGNGETLTLVLPDEECLTSDKEIMVGHQVKFYATSGDINAIDGGDVCLVTAVSSTSLAGVGCSSPGGNTYFAMYPFLSEVYVGTCVVYVDYNDAWDAGDFVKLQVRGYDWTDGVMNDIGGELTIMASVDSCGAAPNCIDDDTIGTWNVDDKLDIGAGDAGMLQIEISDTNDPGTGNDIRLVVLCPYF